MIPPDDLRRVGRLLLAQQWIYAKTMPDNPHWYTLRQRWQRDADFVWTVETLRRYGYEEIYQDRPYTMVNINGMKYWTMGAPATETILINRKYLSPLVDQRAYSAVGHSEDRDSSDQESLAETQTVMDLIGDTSQLNVLDIGCGSGRYLDHQQPASYTGIDPSFERLALLRARHPAYTNAALCCRLEEFVGGDYDLALCLFGSAGFIHPEHIAAIPTLLKPGGRYVLMGPAADDTLAPFVESGAQPVNFPNVHPDLPGERSLIGRFVVIDGRRRAGGIPG